MRAGGRRGWLLALLIALPIRTAAGFDVTACGQTVPAGEVGVLLGDLDCVGEGVQLDAGATLALGGHELRGGSNAGVSCARSRCSIEGPGAIADGGWIGVVLADRVRLTVRNVVFRANDAGIVGLGHNKVTASDVSFVDQPQSSLLVQTVRATNLSVTGNGAASLAAISAVDVRIAGGTITNNATTAIEAGSVRLDAVTVSGNAGPGIRAARGPRLRDSTVTGNDTAGLGIDLRSDRRPRLVASTCGRSADVVGVPWGVCTGD